MAENKTGSPIDTIEGMDFRAGGVFLKYEVPLLPRPEEAEASGLTEVVAGVDASGHAVRVPVVTEKPLVLFLNGQEIVTHMTLGDYPLYLAVGFLVNQRMLLPEDVVTGLDYDPQLGVVVVRTERETNYEETLKKKIHGSGCAQGTQFGAIVDSLEGLRMTDVRPCLPVSRLHAMLKELNVLPSLYLKAGAIHACALLEHRPEKTELLLYMEDVGRHNALDKIAGWLYLHGVGPQRKVFYTTGRLTSEMVIKTVQMGISILVSRSGFTAWGVQLAREAQLTLIGRARGHRFLVLSTPERLQWDNETGGTV